MGTDANRPGAPAALCLVLALTLPCSVLPARSAPEAESFSMVFHDRPAEDDFGTVDLAGLDVRIFEMDSGGDLPADIWQKVLPCFTREAAVHPDWPAVLGAYRAAGEVIRFRPRYPFRAGGVYTCRFLPENLPAGAGEIPVYPPLTLNFTMPSPVRPVAARVTGVYPAGATVPENLLRIYIHFSLAMQRKSVQDHVRLLDDQGEDVILPFVEVEHGLWDTGSRRLTLFFHPGRIKRGVGPHDSMGPPLQAGKTYRLVVSEGLRDARGYPLESAYEQDLIVVEADRRSPDPAAWIVAAPRSSRHEVTLEFHEALDHALLGRFIQVWTQGGEEVHGQVTVRPDGSGWSFMPESPWVAGNYLLMVNPALEDLAGNTAGYLFDEKTGSGAGGKPGQAESMKKGADFLEISFSVPPS